MHNSHWRPYFFNAKFTVFMVLLFLSTFDMFFSRHNSTRKHHNKFSCNLFGVHVLLVHSLTLLSVILIGVNKNDHVADFAERISFAEQWKLALPSRLSST